MKKITLEYEEGTTVELKKKAENSTILNVEIDGEYEELMMGTDFIQIARSDKSIGDILKFIEESE